MNNNTFTTSSTFGDQRDIAAYRPAAAGLLIPTHLRGIHSSAWESAFNRRGHHARVAVRSLSG